MVSCGWCFWCSKMLNTSHWKVKYCLDKLKGMQTQLMNVYSLTGYW